MMYSRLDSCGRTPYRVLFFAAATTRSKAGQSHDFFSVSSVSEAVVSGKGSAIESCGYILFK